MNNPPNNTIIYTFPRQLRYINNIFQNDGKPLPGPYVSYNKKHATKFLHSPRGYDIGNKKLLIKLNELDSIPQTFFPRDKIVLSRQDKKKIYFVKKCNVENGSGISLRSGSRLPKKVPRNHIIQKEIVSKLYQKRKFDLRVLCCVKRTGEVMIFNNILYRINPNKIKNQLDINHQITNCTFHTKEGNQSFFEMENKGIMPHENYIEQLKIKIPEIYKKYLEFSNPFVIEEIQNNGKTLDDYFLINGLDFIPDQDNNLYFLETNTCPGWKAKWRQEYQSFYKTATDYICGKDIDPTIGTIVTNFEEKI